MGVEGWILSRSWQKEEQSCSLPSFPACGRGKGRRKASTEVMYDTNKGSGFEVFEVKPHGPNPQLATLNPNTLHVQRAKPSTLHPKTRLSLSSSTIRGHGPRSGMELALGQCGANAEGLEIGGLTLKPTPQARNPKPCVEGLRCYGPKPETLNPKP